MPPAARKGDKDTGHGCWPPRPNVEGSPDVFINNRPAHRQGDKWAVHCCPRRGCHDSVLAQGSPTVFTNGRQQGRKGDPVACGGRVVEGSPDVFVGGGSGGGSSTTLSDGQQLPGNTNGSGNTGGGETTPIEPTHPPPPPVTNSPSINAQVQHLEEKANDSSTGYCARYVRQAIEAGGTPLDPSTRPTSAKNYGPYLQRHGYTPVQSGPNYTPQPGDVVVHQPYSGGSRHGHIAMYSGNQWISDFKQRDMYGGTGYRQNQNFTVYRPTGGT
jgi:uncharacterized Zn-binding protein involved in type VI secretion